MVSIKRGLLNFLQCVCSALFLATVQGCTYAPSWDRVNHSWVGHPVDEYVDVRGEPTRTWSRDDDTLVYEYVFSDVDPSCVQNFVVDSASVIIDSYHDGSCVPTAK